MNDKIIRPLLVAMLGFAAVQLPLTRCTAAADPSTNLFADAVVATGKGFEIKRSQVDDAFLNYSLSYSANEGNRGGSIPDTDRQMVRSKLLEHLIIDHILVQMATSAEKTNVQKEVDDTINQARTNSPEALEAQIKASGMTLDQLRERAIEQQLCNRVLVRETTNGITVSDAEVKKFYDDHPSDFEIPDRVRVAHILISTLDPASQSPLPPDKKKEKETLANDLKNRAINGEDFAKLVKEYSDDPGSKSKGGEYTFARNHQMVPEFETAAFTLAKTNQISDLVETRYGYHIIKLLEKFPPSKEQFADASQKIHDYLVGQQANKGLPAYLEKLRAGADVKILDPTLVDTSSDKATAPAK
jgi:parvulin-like peptidyl-prolyl isomerase